MENSISKIGHSGGIVVLFYLMGLNIKARLQYGRTFLYEAIGHIISYMFEFLAVWIILDRFSNVGGWSFFEVLFLHALTYCIRATTAALVWEPMSQMSNYVREGTIDRFLVAPVNSFFYIIGRNFGVWTLSHIAFGAIVTVIAGAFLQIHWTLLNVIFIIMAVFGGVLIFGALIVIGGAMAFWTVRSQYFLWILLDTMPLVNYPITIYPKVLQSILTFLIPIALIGYYPTASILGKGCNANFLNMVIIMCVGVVLSYTAYKLWWLGTRHYQGTGS